MDLNNQIIIYQTEDGQTQVDVRMENDMIWLTRQQIAENFHNWQRVGYEDTYHDEPEYCYSATLDEIEKKGWSLVPSKYIEFKNRDEQIDFDAKMKRLQTEMRDLLQQEEASNKELKSLFEKLGYGI